jgi:hypothetical protein
MDTFGPILGVRMGCTFGEPDGSLTVQMGLSTLRLFNHFYSYSRRLRNKKERQRRK